MRSTLSIPERALCPCCGRRDFLVTSFSAAAALLLTRTLGRAADALPGLASASVTSFTPAIPFAATPLPLSAVRLTGGPLKRAQDLGGQNLLRLEMDRLMYRFRERAGLTPKTDDGYGSWEGPGRQLTGAMAGHYLSGVSYMYAATGDAEFKRRTDYMVNEYKEVQDKQSDGYIGALMGNPPRSQGGGPVDGKILFQQIATGTINASAFDLNGMWSPWYVQHKLFAGLRDAYRQTGNRTALDLSVKFAAWVESIVGGLEPAQLQRMLGAEFGGINESFADLYADTDDARWLKLSQRFHHDAMVNPLAQGRDILAGKHGNTNIPKLLGELVRYVNAGNAPDGEAAKFFWNAVVDHHTFATGGHGYDEAFGPPDKLSDEIDGTGQRLNNGRADLRTCESCNVYNMVKMARLLFALEPNEKFAAFHERALLNHVLGSINFNDGQVCYMVPVSPGLTHEYQGLLGMTCCCGTGLENHALHGFGLYNASADKLWVNLYAPSTAVWKESGLNLETSVIGGDTDMATFKITSGAPKEFTLALRRPSWAGEGFALKVNGEPVKDLPKAGAYAEVKRMWKAGDAVEISLPKSLYKEPLVDNTNRVALKWGPYVLAADYGAPNARNIQQAADAAATAAANSVGGGAVGAASGSGSGAGRRGNRGRGPAGPAAKYPVFIAKADEPVGNFLKRVVSKEPAQPDATTDVPVVFHATGIGGDNNEVDFKPFYQLSGRRYGIYQDIYTAEDWQKKSAPPAPAAEPPASSTPA